MTNKGRVLFIVHDLYQEDNHFPLGPAYLAAVLKKEGIEVETYCQDVFHYSNNELKEFLKKNRFDLICLGFLAARFNRTVVDLSKIIREYKKDAWFVLGGHGPSPIPKYAIEKTGADIVSIGESEETIIELINCKINDGDLLKIKGIAYNDASKTKITERRKPVRNLDSLPFPLWEIFPMDKYTTCLKFWGMDESEKSLGMLTSRGCINRCNFCYRLEKGIRFRSIKNVIEEMKTLNEKYGVTYFYMNDELFVYPKKRVFEFVDELETNNLKIKFTANARVDVFDREVAQSLKDAGCQFLNFGIESADQNVLNSMNKNTTVEQNNEALKIASELNIPMGINLLWDDIGDTEETLRKNVALLTKYNHYDQLRTIKPVTPYPGCDLYYEAINRGLLTGADDFFGKFKNLDLITVNFTELPEKKMYELLFEVNTEIILDHYKNTTGDMDAAKALIDQFKRLYFEGEISFTGPRHLNEK